jgi:hypothetical protein
MGNWFKDGRRLLAMAMVLVFAWMFRYEVSPTGGFHKNRWTGAVCHWTQSCWLSRESD